MENVKYIVWGNGKENREEIPKIIWLFWEGKSSEVVNRCIDKLYSTLHGYEINVLNFETLRNYLPNIVPQREELPIANYSDVIRLDLLRTYGGVWMDASILLTEDFDWLRNAKENNKTELIGFFSDLLTTNFDQPILETWFLASTKNSRFIHDWYNEYIKCYTSEKPHEYYNELKDNESEIQGLFKSASVDYLICYVSGIKIMLESSNYRLLMYSANESAHLYKFKLKFTLNQFNRFFLQEKKTDISNLPALIKFVNSARIHLDKCIYNGLYSKQSLLFRISPDKNYSYKKIVRSLNYVKYISKNLLKKYVITNGANN